MRIECPECETVVDGKVISKHTSFDDVNFLEFKVVLLECPVCKDSIVGGSEKYEVAPNKYEWDSLRRLWPQPETNIPFEIPNIARNSLLEARICFKAKAYSACVVMSGRTLEGVCLHYKTKKSTMAQGLKELKDREVIDKRLYQWGEEIRKHRNIGAHASKDRILKEDAKDVLDFAQAICDYVFVLNARFERFKERTSKASSKK